jgi:serine/threonine-protein kinase
VRPVVAVACLAATVAVVAALVFFNSRQYLAGAVKLDLPPDALAFQAHNYIRQFGYTAPPEDTARGLTYFDDYIAYLYRHPGGRTDFATSRPSPILFWYRESPQALNGATFPDPGVVSTEDPPMSLSGMTLAMLDVAGHLMAFRAVPPEIDESAPLANPPDPAPLFAAAGLDLAAFSPVPPKWTPLALADERRAWTGVFPGNPKTPLRVEAAWWRGRPVYFDLVGPWTKPDRMPQPDSTDLWSSIWMDVRSVLLIAGAALGWYNIRTGRGDRRGALRLGGFVFALSLARLLLQAHHTATPWESTLFLEMLGEALCAGAQLWLAYLALEPWVRRRWPRTMVTWARLLAGDVRDALLGRDLLIGILVGLGYDLIFAVAIALMQRRGAPPATSAGLDKLLGLLPLGGSLLNRLTSSLAGALILFLLFFLLRVLLRREWLTAVVFTLAFAVGRGFATSYPSILVPTYAIIYGLLVFVLLRFGLVPVVACIFVADIMITGVFTANFGAWYGTPSLVVCLCVIGLAVWAFRTSLAGRPVLEGVLGD